MSDQPTIGDNSGIDLSLDQVQDILADLADSKKTVSEANGSHRTRLKSVLEQHGLHSKGLAWIREIDAMSESKRSDFLRTFDALFEIMYPVWQDEGANLLDQAIDEQDAKDAK